MEETVLGLQPKEGLELPDACSIKGTVRFDSRGTRYYCMRVTITD